VCFLKKEEEREGKGEKKKQKKGHSIVLVSPLKQILVILALVVQKVLEKTPVL
jgi:hypothetical protein